MQCIGRNADLVDPSDRDLNSELMALRYCLTGVLYQFRRQLLVLQSER